MSKRVLTELVRGGHVAGIVSRDQGADAFRDLMRYVAVSEERHEAKGWLGEDVLRREDVPNGARRMPPLAASAISSHAVRARTVLFDSAIPVRECMRKDERRPEPEAAPKSADPRTDPVEEASEESFPASDPPSWEPLRSGPPSDEKRDHDPDAR